MNNLLVVAVYWALAAAMPVKARSAFSTELTVNILQLENMPDLSQSILSTDLRIETLVRLAEYDSANSLEYIMSKDFLLAKWLQSIMVQTDQSNLKSQLQLIGDSGVGKQTILFYFDKDHPKLPAVMIPGGGERFKDRFELYAPSSLVPVGLTQRNYNLFHDSLVKPHLSTSQTAHSTISSGHPFFQINVNLGHKWTFIVEGLIKNLVQTLPIDDMESKLKLIECLTTIMTNIIASADAIEVAKLKLMRACIRFITPYFTSTSSRLANMAQALELLRSTLVTNGQEIRDQIGQLCDFEPLNRFTILSNDDGGIKTTLLKETTKLVPTESICLLISQCQLVLATSNALSMKTSAQHVGCRTATQYLATDMRLQYFEITRDDFDAQIDNAIRLNKALVFYCAEMNVEPIAWTKMVDFAKSGDVLSLVTIEHALAIIDPRGYLTEKLKVKATAIAQLQKLWQRVKVILVPKTHLSGELPAITVEKWSERDWTDFLIGKTRPLNILVSTCQFVSNFIINKAKTHFSPKLVHQMLVVNQKLGVERSVEMG